MAAIRASLPTLATVALLGLTGSALMAQPGAWGGPGWGRTGWGGTARSSTPPLEGRVEVARFRAEDQRVLGMGSVAVVTMSGDAENSDRRFGATFEAAVENQLLHAGYAAAASGASDGQLVEVRVVRREAVPAEQKRKPLSGEMTMGVSNHGSMMGIGLQYDASKPRAALLSTRLEARIKDRASGAVLWEGRAEMYSRDGDGKWDDQTIADRLAKALFDGFPGKTGEQTLKR